MLTLLGTVAAIAVSVAIAFVIHRRPTLRAEHPDLAEFPLASRDTSVRVRRLSSDVPLQPLVIRRLTPEDAGPYLRLRQQSWEESRRLYGSTHVDKEDLSIESVRERLGRTDEAVFGGFRDGPVAVVCIRRDRPIEQPDRWTFRFYGTSTVDHTDIGAAIGREAIKFPHSLPGVTHITIASLETLDENRAAEQLSDRHMITCPACKGAMARAGSDDVCPTCGREGRVGNCPTCFGKGLLSENRLAPTGCPRCQTKGWIGSCRTCQGAGVLPVPNGYKACATCDGYGHLQIDLRPPEPARFALVVRHGVEPGFLVACGPTRLGFGRWRGPFANVDVRLPDPLVAKEHFEVYWHPFRRVHIVRNLGARYLPSVNGSPVNDGGRGLLVGDVIKIGSWTLEYVGLADS